MALFLLKKVDVLFIVLLHTEKGCENDMRKIQELLTENEEVWFCITEEWQQDFYEEIVSIGANFISGGSITRESISTLMGINRDKEVGYISNQVWYNSLRSEKSKTLKIDYGKYRSGEKNYQIASPDIVPVEWEDFE